MSFYSKHHSASDEELLRISRLSECDMVIELSARLEARLEEKMELLRAQDQIDKEIGEALGVGPYHCFETEILKLKDRLEDALEKMEELGE